MVTADTSWRMGRRLVPTLLAILVVGFAGCSGQDSTSTTSSAGADKALAKLDFRKTVSSAKEKVFPAVVFIKVVVETYESGKKISSEGAGSGVIIDPKGEVLTNWHVIDKATEVRCLLLDGTYYDAKVIGSDKDADLALIQLQIPQAATGKSTTLPGDKSAEAPKEIAFPHAEIGDSSKLREGDFVMAMGAPWGMSRSVSMGIISCTARYLPGISEYSLWMQTDASILPGNSGGPLVNTDGKVVGINTRGSRGEMGFAIPSATIKEVLPQLRQGKMDWSWTGLQLQPLKDFDKNIYFEGTEGVIVAGTDPDSPASGGGIQKDDRIIKVDGKPVSAMWPEDLPALRRFLGTLPKGKEVKVEVLRKGKATELAFTPRAKGKVEGEELDCPRWDMTVKDINQFDNPDLYFHRKKGVFIFGIKSPGNAGSAGLQGQDIVLKIDGKEVQTLDDVKAIHKKAIDNVSEKHRIVFVVLRNGLEYQISVDFSRDYEKE